MSMKKKFLALALAGVVSMPVVANATGLGPNKTVDGNSGSAFDTNMEIKGSVTNKKGLAQAGKIQVELPTSLSFTVNKDGQFQTANTFTVTNKSQDAIDVKVSQFTETLENGGITVRSESELNASGISQKDRSNVSIVLSNNGKKVDLGEIVGQTLQQPKDLISNLGSNQSTDISVKGIAGTAAASTGSHADDTTTATVDQAGTSEDFTLKFLISKHQ